MTTLRLLPILLLLPLSAFAQDDAADRARQRAQGRMGRYRSLGLDEEQRAKLLEMLVAEELGNDKTKAKRQAAIKAMLSDEQKSKFQKMLTVGARAWTDRALRMIGLDTTRFVKPLEMDEEQQKKLDEVLAPAAKRFGEAWAASQKSRWDWKQWLAFAKNLRSDIVPKIGTLLTEEQREGFEAINKKYEADLAKWVAQQERRTGERVTKEEDPAKIAKRLFDRVMKDLDLAAEEAAVIGPMIRALIQHKVIGNRNLAKRRGKMTGESKAKGEDAAKQAVAAYRKAREAYQTKLTELQTAVRELLTVPQESILIGYDLLP